MKILIHDFCEESYQIPDELVETVLENRGVDMAEVHKALRIAEERDYECDNGYYKDLREDYFGIKYGWDKQSRCDTSVIDWFEKFEKCCIRTSTFRDLKTISIPNEATDWMITEYDGWETVYYVLDGKIRRAEA